MMKRKTYALGEAFTMSYKSVDQGEEIEGKPYCMAETEGWIEAKGNSRKIEDGAKGSNAGSSIDNPLKKRATDQAPHSCAAVLEDCLLT